MKKHELPDLPYALDALEPYIDAKTMEIHHGKHHAGYVSKLNTALESFPELQAVPLESLLRNMNSVPEEIRTAVHNNGGGHANHSLFWKIMKPGGGGEPVGELGIAITAAFGGFASFKEHFSSVAANHFGSGWAWLSVGRFGNLLLSCSPNQHNPLMTGLTPVIGLDLWEHAYYLKYQNRRPEYIEAFWNVVDWEQAAKNYADALRALDER